MTNATNAKRLDLIIIGTCLLVAATMGQRAQADSNGADDGPDYSGTSEGFSLGFVYTYGYDYCADASIGDRLRKVWWRLLDYCELSPKQRSVIRENFEWASQNMPSQIPEMRKQWALPIDPNSDEAARRYFYGRFRCDQDSYRKKKTEMEALLDEIEQGHARPDAILTDQCTK